MNKLFVRGRLICPQEKQHCKGEGGIDRIVVFNHKKGGWSFLISLRAGSHLRCYNRCGTSGEAARQVRVGERSEPPRGLAREMRPDPWPARCVRRSCHVDYNNENAACSQASHFLASGDHTRSQNDLWARDWLNS